MTKINLEKAYEKNSKLLYVTMTFSSDNFHFLSLSANKECAVEDQDLCVSVCSIMKRECNLEKCTCKKRPKKENKIQKKIKDKKEKKEGENGGKGMRGKVEKENGLFFYY